MEVIKVKDLKPGMAFSRTLYVDPYNKLIDKEVPITEAIITTLNLWNIKEVETDGYRLFSNDSSLRENYEQTELVGIYNGTDSTIQTASDMKIIEEKLEREKRNKKLLQELSKGDIAPVYVNPQIQRLYNSAKEVVRDSIKHIRDRKRIDKSDLVAIVEKLYNSLDSNKLDLLRIIFNDNKEYNYSNYLYNQHIDTCIFSLIIAKQLKFDMKTKDNLGIGALLHDIGMFIIPQYITEKSGFLTETEYDKIKTHPFLGYKVLLQVAKLSHNIGIIVLHHQELYDGSGYPKGLSGNNINYLARIVTIASVFSALIRVRTYRDREKPSIALTKMLRDLKNKFDPKLISTFLHSIGLYPPATYVLLSNGYTGEVIEANPDKPKEPKVAVLFDENGMPQSKNEIIDISKEQDIIINQALSKFEFEKMIVDKHEKLQ
ncbi:MAG: HD-GYP domain-containing protein [Spirochaetota bacterium]